VRELLEAATHSDLAESAARAKAKLDASLESLERASGAKGASWSRARLAGEANLREEIEEVEQHIRENPLGALLAAAGIGLLLGLAISRRR